MLTYFKYTIFSLPSKGSLSGEKRNRGFTLVELMVVISIATIILTALIIQQSKWNDRLYVSTQAYELALMIRQAQIYSLGVREDTNGSGDKFDKGYGVYFTQGSLSQYILFVDRDGDKTYDSGEAIETKILTRGVTINQVCGSSRCMSGGGPLASVSILFLRPTTKAYISLLNGGGNPVDNPPVTITLKSPNNSLSSVKVEANGQVSISQ